MNSKSSFSRREILKLTGTAALLGVFAPGVTVASPQTFRIGAEKILVVYFSVPETDNPDNMTPEEDNSAVVIDGKVLGNTQYVAGLIAEMTGADIFRIIPKNPYPTDHRRLVGLAKAEQNKNARPAVAENVKNIEIYDTIFIGYPTWWADMPMVLYTFLESHDLSGKIVIPFNTHGGSGFASTIKTIERLQPLANVKRKGFAISRDYADRAWPEVAQWLAELGYKK